MPPGPTTLLSCLTYGGHKTLSKKLLPWEFFPLKYFSSNVTGAGEFTVLGLSKLFLGLGMCGFNPEDFQTEAARVLNTSTFCDAG